jgi:hypothetical protein
VVEQEIKGKSKRARLWSAHAVHCLMTQVYHPLGNFQAIR